MGLDPEAEIQFSYPESDGWGGVAYHRVITKRFKAYPDGVPLVEWDDPIQPSAVLLRPLSMLAFTAAMFWFDAMKERGFKTPVLILPNMPGARQDRVNQEGDFLFTAKSVAKMINDREFPRVILIDPHSEVTPALIDRARVFHTDAVLDGEFDAEGSPQYAAVVSPDAGAEKRAGAVAKLLEVPLIHGWKTRNVSDGKINGFGLQPSGLPHGSRVLVVDDICDGGGTFIGLSDQIAAQGLVPDLYVTHGIFSAGTEVLLQRFVKVFCTDSVIGDKPGVDIIPFNQQLLSGDIAV